MKTSALIRIVWLGVAVQLAGDVVDLRWHATHEEFEGAAEQVEAHWLLWLGVAIGLTTAATAVGRVRNAERALNRGFLLVLLAAGGYGGVSVWHFLEHAAGNDPGVAHVLLAATQIAIVAGATLATLIARRSAPPFSRA